MTPDQRKELEIREDFRNLAKAIYAMWPSWMERDYDRVLRELRKLEDKYASG